MFSSSKIYRQNYCMLKLMSGGMMSVFLCAHGSQPYALAGSHAGYGGISGAPLAPALHQEPAQIPRQLSLLECE